MTAKRRHIKWNSLVPPLRLWAVLVFVLVVSTLASTASSPMPAIALASDATEEPLPEPRSPRELDINGDTTWREVFEQLATSDQYCIRTELGDGLEAALERNLVHLDPFGEQWEESLYGCLERETARRILRAVRAELVSWLADGARDGDEQQARAADDFGDTISEATDLVVGESVVGSLGHDFDVDVFVFEATEAGFYVVDVGLGSLPDSVVYLLNKNGERVHYNDDYARTWASRLYWHAPATGDYYAVVGSNSRKNRGSYVLTVAEIQIPDDHPNTIGSATPITVGEVTSGTVDYRQDVDSFRFDAEQGVIYKIEAVWGTLSYTHIYILAEGGGHQVSGQSDREARRSHIVWLAPASGRYVVVAQGSGTGTYTLAARALDITDNHGDTGSEATSVAVGSSVSGSVDYFDDIDAFVFQAAAGAYYELDLTLGTLTNWLLVVGSASDSYTTFYRGATFAYRNEDGGYPDSRIVWNAPISGEAHVLVSGRGQPGTYRLDIREIELVDDFPDTAEGANALALGQTTGGAREHDSDVDVFAFEAEAGARYKIDVPSSTLYRTHVVLRDADGRELESEYNHGADQDLPIFWKARESGTYFVSVGGWGRGTYSALITEFVDDHANESSGATTIQVGRTLSGSLDYDNDGDVFVFEAEAGVFYEIGVELDTLSSSRLTLEDSDGVEVDRDDDYQEPNPSRIFWEAPSSGQHYVSVRGGDAGVTGSYQLTVVVSQLTDSHANTLEGATTVEVGEPVRGELEYEKDVDVFAFQAEEGVHYEIRPESGTPPDAWVLLRSSDGEWFSRTDLPDEEGHPVIVFEASVDEKFFVEVQGRGAGSYTLTIDRSQQVDDHSGTQSGATKVKLNEVVHGRVEYSSDDDVFAFQAQSGQVYAIDVARWTLPVASVYVGPYRVEMTGHCSSSEAPEVSRIYWTAPVSGEYYVLVGGCGWDSIGSYTITIQTIGDDHADAASEATAVVVGEPVAGGLDHDGDLDYFVFSAEAGQLYEIRTIRGTVEYADVSVPCAADEDLNDHIFTNDSPVVWKAPRSADYIVCVGGYGTGSYSLIVSISDVVDDHSDASTGSTPIALGQATQGTLDYDRDIDAFQVTVDHGTIYQIEVELGTLPGSVVSTRERTGCGQRLDQYETDREGSSLIVKARATGAFYVYVCGADVGTYTLTVSVADVEDDYSDFWAGAATIVVDEVVQGALEYEGDQDSFLFEAVQGVKYIVRLSSSALPYSVLGLGETSGPLLARDDDYGEWDPPQIVWEATASGTYYVVVYSPGTGTYTLTVSVGAVREAAIR